MNTLFEQFSSIKNVECKNVFVETLNPKELRYIRDKIDINNDLTTFEKMMFFCRVKKINHNKYELFKKFMNAKKFTKHFWSHAYQIEYKNRVYNCTNAMNLLIILKKYFNLIQESDDECISIWKDTNEFIKLCGKEYKIKREVNEKDQDYIKHVWIAIDDDFVKIRGLLENNN